MNIDKTIAFLLSVSVAVSINAQEMTLGDPSQFTSITAKGSIGDSTNGAVDMVEFEALGGGRAACAIAEAFNKSKRLSISTPPNDRHKSSSEVYEIVLTSPKGGLTIYIFSQQLAMVVGGDKRQLYWFEEAFTEEGFGARFEKLLFADRGKIGLKVRELSRQVNEFGSSRKTGQ
jgi:hypothetical protein